MKGDKIIIFMPNILKNTCSQNLPPQLLKNLVIVGDNIDLSRPFQRNVERAFYQAKSHAYGLYFLKMEPYLNKYTLFNTSFCVCILKIIVYL